MIEEAYACIDIYGPLKDDDFDFNPDDPIDNTLKRSRRPESAIFFTEPVKEEHKTLSYDKYGRYYDRMIDLIKRASYWSACALAWTMKKCGLNKTTTDTIGQRGKYEASQVEISKTILSYAPTRKPYDAEVAEDLLKKKRPESSSSSLSLNLVSLTRIGLIGLIGALILELVKKIAETATDNAASSALSGIA
ncbi:MAG: hypothetical protein GF316_13710 [Candidatus Lokiarchaeota archaeon]|nr:hypothetical protein [Candidatus Lokiarchaeota archaeon]